MTSFVFDNGLEDLLHDVVILICYFRSCRDMPQVIAAEVVPHFVEAIPGDLIFDEALYKSIEVVSERVISGGIIVQ